MNIEELETLVAQDESETVEFKESTNSRSLKEAGETLCGFLNNSGGSILFGVTPKKKIIGQEVSERTKKDIAENILRNFDPHAPIQVEYIDVGKGKHVIVLCPNMEKNDPPYYFNKVCYFRSQSVTQIMPPTKQLELLEARKWAVRSWESLPAIGTTINDLDHDEISKTVLDGIRYNRIPPQVDPNNICDVLMRFELMHNNEINNAAAVLFAKRPATRYNQCLLRLARFRGRDKREFIDNQQEYGHAFKILSMVEDFCNRHLPIASRFVDYQMQRIDEPFLPPLAIREAVINAICHRDYTMHGSAINLAIYDDRVEIDSYGDLPKKLTVKDLKIDHKSEPRNPKIANIFYRRGMIEQWGRGTQQIVELCKADGHPEPQYRQHASGLTVCLYSKNPMQSVREVIPTNRIELTERHQLILSILAESGEINVHGILAKLPETEKVSDRMIRMDLNFLRENGIVGSTGRTKSNQWYIKK